MVSRIIDTVFIDLDGTLWDESKLDEKIRETVDKNLLAEVPKFINQEIELKGYYTWTNVYKYIGINYCDLISKHTHQIYPYPKTIETLTILQKAYSLWLVSDAGLDYTQLKLNLLGLTQFFDGIITSDQTKTMKSNTDWWSKAIKISKKSQDRIVVIGDSKNDVVPTSELGVFSIYVGELESLSFRLPKEVAHCSSFAQIPLLLNNVTRSNNEKACR
jgi:FMN phosphatase YigB (HAD superfamily)